MLLRISFFIEWLIVTSSNFSNSAAELNLLGELHDLVLTFLLLVDIKPSGVLPTKW